MGSKSGNAEHGELGETNARRLAYKRAKEEMEERWYYSYLPNNISGGGTQPLIPIFITEALGGSVAQVGVISAASSVAAVPSSVLWGNVSDRMKLRKVFVVLGFIGMGISFILMGFAQNIEQYLLANIVMGLLATASGPIAIVLIMETSGEKKWATKIGRFSKIGGWGWVFGLVIGATWLSIPSNSHNVPALRMMFVISAILSFLSAYMAWVWIDEPKVKIHRIKAESLVRVNLRPHERSRFLPMRLLHIPGPGSFRKLRLHGFSIGHSLSYYFAVTFIFTTGFIMFYTMFPIFMVTKLGIMAGEVFVIYLASSIASALLYERAGHLVDKSGAKEVQALALFARILLIPSFIFLLINSPGHWGTVAFLVFLQVLMGICWALISVSGTAIASELAPQNAKGESMGLYIAVQGVASIIGALAGGIVAFLFGYMVAILIPMAIVAVALILFLRIKLISKEVDKGAGQEAKPGDASS